MFQIQAYSDTNKGKDVNDPYSTTSYAMMLMIHAPPLAILSSLKCSGLMES